jgi:hypothetical protein
VKVARRFKREARHGRIRRPRDNSMSQLINRSYTRRSGTRKTYEYALSWSIVDHHITWSATVWDALDGSTKGLPAGAVKQTPRLEPQEQVIAALEHAIENLDRIEE